MGDQISVISVGLNVIATNVGDPTVKDYFVLLGYRADVRLPDSDGFTVVSKPEESSGSFAS